jgi:hypothetical protein
MNRRSRDDEAPPSSPTVRLMEIVAAVVLSAAGLMASWASHQGAMWNGMQSIHMSRANLERGVAAKARLEGDLTRAVEVDLFSDWIEAKSRGNDTLAQFYRTRMPVDFRATFEAWLATRPLDDPDAPPTPFAMPGSRPSEFATADEAERVADAEFDLGEKANHASYAYNRAGVVLATSMFFGGIGQVFRQPSVRFILTAVAIVTWLIGLQLILVIPAVSLGELSLADGSASPPARSAKP